MIFTADRLFWLMMMQQHQSDSQVAAITSGHLTLTISIPRCNDMDC
jgi:hypothetical protein